MDVNLEIYNWHGDSLMLTKGLKGRWQHGCAQAEKNHRSVSESVMKALEGTVKDKY